MATPQFHTGAMIALVVPDPETYAIYPPTEESVPADELHITLAYLGESVEISPEERAAILDACQVLADTTDAPEALFPATTGVFPPDPEVSDENPTVPFYAQPMPTEPFGNLREDLLIHLGARGVGHFVSTRHPVFHPHVTLTYAPLDSGPDMSYLPTPVPVSFGTLICKFGDEVHEFQLNTKNSGPELPITASVRAQLKSLSARTETSEDYLLSLYLRQRDVTSTPAQTRAQAAMERTKFLADQHHQYNHFTRINSLLERARLEADAGSRLYTVNRALALAARTNADDVTQQRHLDGLTASLHALIADGNSSLARSLRARKQLRDRYGRWIEMGGGVRFKIKGKGWVHGVATGVDVNAGRVQVALEDGTTVSVPANKVEQPKAILGLKNTAKKLFTPKSIDRKGNATLPGDHDPEKAAADKAQDDKAVQALERIHKNAQDANPDATISGGNLAPLVNDINLKAAESSPAHVNSDTITFTPSKNPLKDNPLTVKKSDIEDVRASIDRITLDNLPPQAELDALPEDERTKAIQKARSKAYSAVASLYNERNSDPELARMPAVRDEEIQPGGDFSPNDNPTNQELINATNESYNELAGKIADDHLDASTRDRIKKTLDSANKRLADGTDDLPTYLGNLDRIKEFANAHDKNHEAFGAFAEDIDNVHASADGTDDVSAAKDAIDGIVDLVDFAVEDEGGWTDALDELNADAKGILKRIDDGTYLDKPADLPKDLRALRDLAETNLPEDATSDDKYQEYRNALTDAADKLDTEDSSSEPQPVKTADEPSADVLNDPAAYTDDVPDQWEDTNNAYFDVLNTLADVLLDPNAENGLKVPNGSGAQDAIDNFHAALNDWDNTSWDEMTPEIANNLVEKLDSAGKDLVGALQGHPEINQDDLNTFDGALNDLKGEVQAATGTLPIAKAPTTPAVGDIPNIASFEDAHDRLQELYSEIDPGHPLHDEVGALGNQVANIGKGIQGGWMTPQEGSNYLNSALDDFNKSYAGYTPADDADVSWQDALDDTLFDLENVQAHLSNGNFDSGNAPEAPAAPDTADTADNFESLPFNQQSAFKTAAGDLQDWLDSLNDYIDNAPADVPKATHDFYQMDAAIGDAIEQFQDGNLNTDEFKSKVNDAVATWLKSDGIKEVAEPNPDGEYSDLFDPETYVGNVFNTIGVDSTQPGVPENDPWAGFSVENYLSEQSQQLIQDYDAKAAEVSAVLPEDHSPLTQQAKKTRDELHYVFDSLPTPTMRKKKETSTKKPDLPPTAPEGSKVIGIVPKTEAEKNADKKINGAGKGDKILVQHPDGSMHVYQSWSSIAAGKSGWQDYQASDKEIQSVTGNDDPKDAISEAIDTANLHLDSLDKMEESGDDDEQAVAAAEKDALEPLIDSLEQDEQKAELTVDQINADPALFQAIIDKLKAKDSGVSKYLASYLQSRLDSAISDPLMPSDLEDIKNLIDLTSLAPSVTPAEKAQYDLAKEDLDLNDPALPELAKEHAPAPATAPETPAVPETSVAAEGDTNAAGALGTSEAVDAWKGSLGEYLATHADTHVPGSPAPVAPKHNPLSPQQISHLDEIAARLKGTKGAELNKIVADHVDEKVNDDELIQHLSSLLMDPSVTNDKTRGMIRSAQQGIQTNKPTLIPILRPKFKGDPATLSTDDLYLPSPEIVKGDLNAILAQHADGKDLSGLDPENSVQDAQVSEQVKIAQQRVQDALQAFNDGDVEHMIASLKDAQDAYDAAIEIRKKSHKNDTIIRRLRARRRRLNETYAPFVGQWPDPINGGNVTKWTGKTDTSGTKFQLDSEGQKFFPGDEVERLSAGHGVQGNVVYVEGVRGLNGEGDFRGRLNTKGDTQMIAGSAVRLLAVGPNNPLYYDPDYKGPKVDESKHSEGKKPLTVADQFDPKSPVNTMGTAPEPEPVATPEAPSAPETPETPAASIPEPNPLFSKINIIKAQENNIKPEDQEEFTKLYGEIMAAQTVEELDKLDDELLTDSDLGVKAYNLLKMQISANKKSLDEQNTSAPAPEEPLADWEKELLNGVSVGDDLAGHPNLGDELDTLPEGSKITVDADAPGWTGTWTKQPNGQWTKPGNGYLDGSDFEQAPANSITVDSKEPKKSDLYNSYLGEINYPNTNLKELDDLLDKIKTDYASGDLTMDERSALASAVMQAHKNYAGASGSQYHSYQASRDDINAAKSADELNELYNKIHDDFDSGFYTSTQVNALDELYDAKKASLGGGNTYKDNPFKNGQLVTYKGKNYVLIGPSDTFGQATIQDKDSGAILQVPFKDIEHPDNAPASYEGVTVGDKIDFFADALQKKKGTVVGFNLDDPTQSWVVVKDDETGKEYERTLDWVKKNNAQYAEKTTPESSSLLPEGYAQPPAGSKVLYKTTEDYSNKYPGEEWYAVEHPDGSIHTYKNDGESNHSGLTPGSMDAAPNIWEKVAPGSVPTASDAPDTTTDETTSPSVQTYDISGWTPGKAMGGSNGARLYTDPEGNKYVVKPVSGPNFTPSQHTADMEALGSVIYNELGYKAPEIGFTTLNGKPAVVSKFVDYTPFGQLSPDQKAAAKQKMYENYAIDTWLANYDIIGLGQENFGVDADGNLVYVDNGGAFDVKAQGDNKAWWGTNAVDFDTWSSGTAPSASSAWNATIPFYKDITPEQKIESAKKLQNITDQDIFNMVDKIPTMSSVQKLNLADTLAARRDSILKKAGLDLPDQSDAPTPPSPTVTDKFGKEIKVGDTVVHKAKTTNKVITGTVVKADGKNWLVKYTDENGQTKTTKIAPEKWSKVDTSPEVGVGHNFSPVEMSNLKPEDFVAYGEPDPSSPWYGKSAPEKPVSKFVSTVDNPIPVVGQDWYDEAEKQYHAYLTGAGKPIKPLNTSASWHHYENVINHGMTVSLEKLHDKGKISDALYQQASDAIAQREKDIADEAANLQSALAQWKQDMDEYHKAAGLPTLKLPTHEDLKLLPEQTFQDDLKIAKGMVTPMSNPAYYTSIGSQKGASDHNGSNGARNVLKPGDSLAIDAIVANPDINSQSKNSLVASDKLIKEGKWTVPLGSVLRGARTNGFGAFRKKNGQKAHSASDFDDLVGTIQFDAGLMEMSVGDPDQAGYAYMAGHDVIMNIYALPGVSGSYTASQSHSGERGFVFHGPVVYLVTGVSKNKKVQHKVGEHLSGGGTHTFPVEVEVVVVPQALYEQFGHFEGIDWVNSPPLHLSGATPKSGPTNIPTGPTNVPGGPTNVPGGPTNVPGGPTNIPSQGE